MRPRREIEKEYKQVEFHIREILLDIRDILVKQNKRKRKQGGKNVSTD